MEAPIDEAAVAAFSAAEAEGCHSLPGGVRLVFHVRPELDLWVGTHSRGMSDWLHVRPELDLWAVTHSRGVSDSLQHGLYTACHQLNRFLLAK
jgi:hypothetical protein